MSKEREVGKIKKKKKKEKEKKRRGGCEKSRGVWLVKGRGRNEQSSVGQPAG